ncbi:MAG: hypothetical protein ACFFEN_06710 [Candidatus Thorarchaeota archaeon]
MNEDQEEKNDEQITEEDEAEENDLKNYMAEIQMLETDFSDLEELDIEELQEIQDAIAQVKEGEELSLDTDEITESSLGHTESETELKIEKDIREDMISDFSDLDEIDLDELRDMQEAIESVKHEEMESVSEGEQEVQKTQEVSIELEERIKKELLKRKDVEEEVITAEKFLEYIKKKRDKIWYHALYYLAFNIEDHIASKALLYDVLKDVTSKSPIDPIPENQFYFGLGYLLRLHLNTKQVVRFLRDGKFKININIDSLKEMLEISGEPISTRPIIKEQEKKKMYKDFLKENFFDI